MEIPPKDIEFNESEIEIMILIPKGMSAKMIADEIKLAIPTVYGYFKTLRNKTNTHNIASLSAYASKHADYFISIEDSKNNQDEPKEIHDEIS